MADVSRDTIDRLWNETRGYSWESMRQGLNIIFNKEIITQEMYDDLIWAINKLENLGEDFPETSGELYSRIGHFM